MGSRPLKAGQPLSTLGPELLGKLATHPAQLRAVERIAELLTYLDVLETPEDYSEFQHALFAEVFQTYARRAECTQSVKRIRAGKLPREGVAPPEDVGLGEDVEAWQFEEFLYERVARQFRSVGDGLAWRSYRYDRRALLALARNDSPGPLIEKAGLGFELGAIEDLWKSKGHFALLHDLTNCLRIADLTEVTADGMCLLREIKSKPGVGRGQRNRMNAVVEAVTEGGPLPGASPDAGLVVLTTPYATDLSPLRDVLNLARSHGARGLKLPPGRALVAFDLIAIHNRFGPDAAGGIHLIESARARVLKRAGLQSVVHQLKGSSADTAARSPIMAPFAIYPLTPDVRASLICDLLIFETFLDPSALVRACDDLGLRADLELPRAHGELADEAPVITVYRGRKGLTLRSAGLNLLLYELVRPVCWANGVAEVLSMHRPPSEPVIVFADEEDSWVALL